MAFLKNFHFLYLNLIVFTAENFSTGIFFHRKIFPSEIYSVKSKNSKKIKSINGRVEQNKSFIILNFPLNLTPTHLTFFLTKIKLQINTQKQKTPTRNRRGALENKPRGGYA
jgi:hypothetical protein